MLFIIIWTHFISKIFYFAIYLKVEAGDMTSDDEEVIGETEMENTTTTTTTTHGCAGSFKLEGGHKKLD